MSRVPAHLERTLLQSCPQCGYAFTGLPSSGTCPECGFVYDELTIMVKGISRGLKNVPWHRKLLWVWIALGGTFAPQVLMFALFSGLITVTLLVFGLLWLAPLIYLLATRQGGERKGVDTFVFAAGGFGSCTQDGDHMFQWKLTDWGSVNAVRLDRKSANWHRLRLGRMRGNRGRLRDVAIDAVIRCDAEEALEIERVIESRM